MGWGAVIEKATIVLAPLLPLAKQRSICRANKRFAGHHHGAEIFEGTNSVLGRTEPLIGVS